MIVAQIKVTTGRFSMSNEKSHVVAFDDLEKAQGEYKRIAEFLQRKADHTNDVPKIVEMDGMAGSKLTVNMDDITTIALFDFVKANEAEKGTKDAFPFLFREKV